MDRFFIGESPDNQEKIKGLFQSGCPVVCKGIRYSHVSAIIYQRNKNGTIIVVAELKAENANSVTIAKINDIKEANPTQKKKVGAEL